MSTHRIAGPSIDPPHSILYTSQTEGDLSMEWLVPMMRHRQCAKGDVLFRRGDPATELYVVFSGSLRLVDLAVEPPRHRARRDRHLLDARADGHGVLRD